MHEEIWNSTMNRDKSNQLHVAMLSIGKIQQSINKMAESIENLG